MVSFARLARPDDNREHQTVSAAGLIVGYEARENVARTPRWTSAKPAARKSSSKPHPWCDGRREFLPCWAHHRAIRVARDVRPSHPAWRVRKPGVRGDAQRRGR